MENCTLNGLTAKMGDGDFEFKGALTGATAITIDNGDVDLAITGNEADYIYALNSEYGEVLVNGKPYKATVDKIDQDGNTLEGAGFTLYTDNSYTTTENTVMRAISFRLGINQRDYISMFTRHVSSKTRNRGSADSGGYSSSSYSSTSSSSAYSDPYKVLGLDSSATDEEVKKAYRRLAMKYHPDKVENMGEEVKKSAEAQFRKINEAYEQIKTARGMK
jgi:DnaJ-domain-containing protein 1